MPGARVEAGDSVTLRTVEPADAPFLQRAYAEPELRKPLGRSIRTRSQVEAEIGALAEDDDRLQFLICLEEGTTAELVDPEAVTPIGVILARRVSGRPARNADPERPTDDGLERRSRYPPRRRQRSDGGVAGDEFLTTYRYCVRLKKNASRFARVRRSSIHASAALASIRPRSTTWFRIPCAR